MGTYILVLLQEEKRLNPKVSICVPTYNRADSLRRCLASLIALTYPNVVEQFYFMMKQEDKHKDETDKLSATVEANTKVLTELCTLIKTLVK